MFRATLGPLNIVFSYWVCAAYQFATVTANPTVNVTVGYEMYLCNVISSLSKLSFCLLHWFLDGDV